MTLPPFPFPALPLSLSFLPGADGSKAEEDEEGASGCLVVVGPRACARLKAQINNPVLWSPDQVPSDVDASMQHLCCAYVHVWMATGAAM